MLPELPWVLGCGADQRCASRWIARQVNQLEPDVVFSPMQTMGTAGRRYRLVLTLHDLIYYRNRTPPRDLAWPIRLLWRLYHLAWWPQRLLLNRADAVVTVSETTEGADREHRLTRRPITVVRNAADRAGRRTRAGAARRAATWSTWARSCPTRTSRRSRAAMHAAARLPAAPAQPDRRRRRARLADTRAGRRRSCSTTASATTTTPTLLRTRPRWSPRPATRGSASRWSRRWRVGTPVVVSDIPIFREVGGERQRCTSRRTDVRALAAGRDLGAGEARRSGSALGASRLRASHGVQLGRSAQTLLEWPARSPSALASAAATGSTSAAAIRANSSGAMANTAVARARGRPHLPARRAGPRPARCGAGSVCPNGGTPPMLYPVADFTVLASAIRIADPRRRAEDAGVHPVRAGGQHDQRLAVRQEHQALHDRGDLAADRRRRLRRRVGAVDSISRTSTVTPSSAAALHESRDVTVRLPLAPRSAFWASRSSAPGCTEATSIGSLNATSLSSSSRVPEAVDRAVRDRIPRCALDAGVHRLQHRADDAAVA